ncbi:diguanylate cyclase [Lysinibacillus xylanilyticus]|uniref:sensor domain-containing diguanylate cyclase n=1 Tax=Lysinibacillus xylanilyticus TaxID=582475 RepID=UPI002E2171DC|nr:diguanylate cyclase [Lysinibacillus xylanilyticus]
MMKNKIIKTNPLFYFFIVLIFTFTQFSLPCHAAELSEPNILGKHYEIFRDSSKKITIEDLLSGTYDNSFVTSKENYLFFWHTKDTIWLRLDTDEILKDTQESYWLEVTDKLDSIDMYLVKEDGTYSVQKRGISNIDDQNIHYRSNLFQIQDPSVQEIYIKLDGELPLNSISYLFTTDSFINKIIEYKYLTGIFYGFLSALLIYNLFLFFSLKDKAYFYYVLYMFSFILYQATLNSLDIELVGELLPKWYFIKSSAISGNILLLFMILFCKEFLELKKYVPRFHNFGNVLLWITILSLIASFIIPDVMITNNFTTIFAVVVFIFLWLSGIFVLLKGQKMARFYMVGWTVLLGSIIVQALAFLSLIPFHPVIFEEVPAIAAIFESIFLSLALGDKINIIKKEHQEMQQTLNETLEHKVKERTHELERAKIELEKLANTDRLTQIPNRVRLDDVLEEAFEHAQYHEAPFSIILLDIDYFKEVNDEFGHQVGDLVLTNVAEILQNTIREQDTVGRWGGEEFLVICPQTTLDDALKLSEKLRQQLENHQFPVVQRNTSSFGVTSYLDGDTRNTLLSRCDKALYQAKERGRNCVEILIDDANVSSSL